MSSHSHDHGIRKISTKELILNFIRQKRGIRNKISLESNSIPPAPPRSKINYLAIIMDGEVQEIMRAENRLAALLLSDPKFVEFSPEELPVDIGWTYVDGKFISGE